MSAENVISRAIIKKYSEKLCSCLRVQVAFVGAGPSSLMAARELAAAGLKVAIFERRLSPGGGIWGGGMLFNEAVVQDNVLSILDSFNISYEPVPDAPGYYTVDSVELASGLIFGAKKAGVQIFNAISVEDIVFKDNRVQGLVINWSVSKNSGLPIDPLTIIADIVVDGTGHPSEVLRYACEKAQVRLDTETGKIIGERPMWVESAEQETVAGTRQYYPGLYACGMSATNASGGYRMGPIFGGMLLSGQKLAAQISEQLQGTP
ncbi:MAG: thiazole biosynthesis protein [Oligosphaeraceae bacterium]|nr:thiazole biosynthesis protein [Oligosphaeraceae bacterium]